MTMTSDNFTLIVQVARKQTEAERICSFELVDPHGRALPPFEAGAHLDVRLTDDLSRQYSISNNPADDKRYRLAVLQEEESRGGSDFMHKQVNEGDLMMISAPRNHFSLVDDASHSLLFAGGIGITPILSMAKALSARGASFQLHYAARSAAKMAFRSEIDQSDISAVTQYYLSDGPENQSFRQQLPKLVPPPDTATHVYVCGPNGFIDAVMSAFEDKGWDSHQLHTEHFAGAEQDTSGDTSFEVELASSGEVYTIPADRTVFEVLDENGVFIATSCEQGVCGTCLTPVLEGEPDHRDMFMDEDEHAANDQFTPCCSRSKSAKLVIDL